MYSGAWTPSLKSKVPMLEEKSEFYMSYEEFVENFIDTIICYNCASVKFSASLEHVFWRKKWAMDKVTIWNVIENQMAFFKIEIPEAVDASKDIFFIRAWQQGNHLKSFYEMGRLTKLRPAQVNFSLFRISGEQHIQSAICNEDTACLMLNPTTLKSGMYMLIVDYLWNGQSEAHHKTCQQIDLSITSPAPLSISKMRDKDGL